MEGKSPNMGTPLEMKSSKMSVAPKFSDDNISLKRSGLFLRAKGRMSGSSVSTNSSPSLLISAALRSHFDLKAAWNSLVLSGPSVRESKTA